MNSIVTVSILFLIYINSFTNQQHTFLRYIQSVINITSPGTLATNMSYLQRVNFITSPATLGTNLSLVSTNGFWNLKLQDDGNLVQYDPNGIAIWASGTNWKGTKPHTLKLQEDGDMVLLDSKNRKTWATNTKGRGKAPYSLHLQADGNLVLYDSGPGPIWASNVYFGHEFPSGGCVWLFSECYFKGTKQEYCEDFKTLNSTTSSILVPEPNVTCSSSKCLSLEGSQKFTIFRPFDNIQNYNLSADFDAFGHDFHIGLFASDQSNSLLYHITIGGWQNVQSRVFKSFESICTYQIGVKNTLEKTSYKLFVDKLNSTISMNVNGVEAINCKITNMTGSDIKYYGFASSHLGPKVCFGSGSSSNCSITYSSPVKVFSEQNFSGEELTISNPNVCLKNANFDKKIASMIMFPNKTELNKSNNTGMIIGILVGIVGFVAVTIFLFIAYKKKCLCWRSNPNSPLYQETFRTIKTGKDAQIQNNKPEYAPPEETPGEVLNLNKS